MVDFKFVKSIIVIVNFLFLYVVPIHRMTIATVQSRHTMKLKALQLAACLLSSSFI